MGKYEYAFFTIIFYGNSYFKTSKHDRKWKVLNTFYFEKYVYSKQYILKYYLIVYSLNSMDIDILGGPTET